MKLHQNMIKVVLAGLLVGLNTHSVFAQDKSAPPPTQFETADTTAETLNIQSPQDSAEINLPEVLILGKDRAVRSEGAKAKLSPESPAMTPQEWSNTPVEGAKDLQGQKVAPGVSTKHPWKSLLRFEGGKYRSFQGEASLRNEPHWGGYYLQAWLDRSDGQYLNSQYSKMGLAGNLRFDLAEGAAGKGYGSFSLFDHGLYGATFQDLVRHGNMLNAGGQFNFELSHSSSFNFSLELNNLNVFSDTSDTQIEKTQDFWYRLGGVFETTAGAMQIQATGKYLGETRHWTSPIKTHQTDFAELALKGIYPWGNKISTEIGLAMQSSAKDSVNRQTRFSPEIRFTVIVTPRLGLTLRGFTGYEYKPYSQRWQENPYLADRMNLTPDEIRWGASLKMDYKLVHWAKLTSSVERSDMKRLFYWRRDSLGLFELVPIADPVLWQYSVGLSSDVAQWLTFNVGFIGYADEVTINGNSVTNRLPYRPEFRIPAQAIIRLPWQVELQINTQYTGKRRAQLNGSQTLSSYFSTQSMLSKHFLTHYTAYLRFENILDDNYALWEQYPVTGFQAFLGVRAKF